ncbi:hypothetical protein B0H11DRAFT_1163117 [Mycena galericulata]|nr:hypothetical protein B0H11DRAFT_1163117 [Mycena galericulata]
MALGHTWSVSRQAVLAEISTGYYWKLRCALGLFGVLAAVALFPQAPTQCIQHLPGRKDGSIDAFWQKMAIPCAPCPRTILPIRIFVHSGLFYSFQLRLLGTLWYPRPWKFCSFLCPSDKIAVNNRLPVRRVSARSNSWPF